MALTLPKQSFVALIAVAWSDGTIKKIEASALLRTAKECGVEGDDLAEIEKAIKTKTDLAAFDPGDMPRWERVLTYALASWLAQLDGVVSTGESEALAALGQKLDVDQGTRARAASAAFDIAVLPEGGRPDKYDFAKLTARLHDKLPKLAAS